MKLAIAVLTVIGMLSSPIACMSAVCPQPHSCCSGHKSFNACPLDILSLAKAAKATTPAVPATAVIAAIQPLFTFDIHVSIVADQDKDRSGPGEDARRVIPCACDNGGHCVLSVFDMGMGLPRALASDDFKVTREFPVGDRPLEFALLEAACHRVVIDEDVA